MELDLLSMDTADFMEKNTEEVIFLENFKDPKTTNSVELEAFKNSITIGEIIYNSSTFDFPNDLEIELNSFKIGYKNFIRKKKK